MTTLKEGLTTATGRTAFDDYGAWLLGKSGAHRASLQIPKHLGFFAAIDDAGDSAWAEDQVTRLLGAKGLRQYANPVRWLREERGYVFDAKARQCASDEMRIESALGELPEGSRARSVLESFVLDLREGKTGRRLSALSTRLALRPAVSLLAAEDPAGRRLPSQATLMRYLTKSPGQGASVSRFLTFLESTYGHSLERLTPEALSNARRRGLDAQLSALVLEGPGRPDFEQRWLKLALPYFHRLGTRAADVIRSQGRLTEEAQGYSIDHEGKIYWIPKASAAAMRYSNARSS